MLKRISRFTVIVAALAIGLWLFVIASGPSTESVSRQQAQLALGRDGVRTWDKTIVEEIEDGVTIVKAAAVAPAEVNLQDVPHIASKVDQNYEDYVSGSADVELNEGPVNEGKFWELVEESMAQDVDDTVQKYEAGSSINALTAGVNFKSIDYTQSQQGVPPDPDIMVGTDHIVVGVNTSFAVYDKSGNTLIAPTLFSSFWGSNCGTGSGVNMFDPFLDYDEEDNRYVLGITAYDPNVNGGDNGYACIAVSKTDSATGEWWLYSFDGNPGGGADYFFDYPHLGVGQDALYLGANMFGSSFVRNHIFAYDKDAMYTGASANSVKFNVGSSNFTLQPAKMHGHSTGGWPTNVNEPHYFVDAQFGNNQNQLTVWQLSDPWGSPSFTQAGTVNVNTYSLPVNQRQLGGSDMQGNDDRLLDVKYWGGELWTTHTIGCNPGGGTINCVRWYQIDISSGSPSVLDQGTFASSGIGRSFPAIAPNQCGDMLVGYTRTSTSTYPSVYVAGREAGDPAGQLKHETLLHAGEAVYTAYDSVPRRWGDYTGMAIDPDGVTFWYVGEYSRNQATARWSTWVGSFQWPSCTGGPTPTPSNTPPPTNTPLPTNTPEPGTCTTYSSADTPISMPNGVATISSDISVSGSGTIDDINISVDMPHAWVGDLIFTVSHGGNSATIIDQPGVPASNFGCSGDDILATLDDEAATAVEGVCAGSAPTINGTFSPNQALSVFDGTSGNGTWTLTVEDTYTSADAGSLDSWSVEICTVGAPPTDTPVPPTATNTPLPTATNTPIPTATNTPLPTATNTPIPPTPTNTPQPGGSVIYVSSTSGGNAGGVSFADEDILAYDTSTGVWSMYLDGSDVGLSGSGARDIDAFTLLSDGRILMSFVAATTIPDVGSIDDSDIIEFTPTSLGTTTSGTFAMFFDGSDVELTSNGEDIDGIAVSPAGNLLISTTGSPSVSGVSGDHDEDLLEFTATQFGDTTIGTWSMYFDGTDVGLNGGNSEDVGGAWVDGNGDIYLTTRGTFSVAGVSGDASDIFTCVPGSLGTTTTCTFSAFWDGSAFGYSSENIDGFHIVP